MSDKLISLAELLNSKRSPNTSIAYHNEKHYSLLEFDLAVKFWVAELRRQPWQNYALYTEAAYPFAVLLFALLHANKQVWLPGNNLSGTAQQLSANCQLIGDWGDGEFDYCLTPQLNTDLILTRLNPFSAQLVIFTSGSTGVAKPIVKCLQQFELEVAMLERYWGKRLVDAVALSTVSHQHIYGLLFRLFWPLAAGRIFVSQLLVDPETLLPAARGNKAYWVASPAQLKRLGQHSPWQDIAKLNAIFSSGGALSIEAAQQIVTAGRQAVLEIYGCSETGGIAWRQQSTTWNLFADMKLAYSEEKCVLYSPYLFSVENVSGEFEATSETEGYALDDQISLLDDTHFLLQGRNDRIVKVEEKRLSLAELEQKLQIIQGVAEAYALLIRQNRDIVAVALVLDADGLKRLSELGKNRFIRQIRQSLAQWFEVVVLPRKWLVLNALPLTPQGKIAHDLLVSLMAIDKRHFPQVHSLELGLNAAQIGIKVPHELSYFPDHFPKYPILPGVVQLAWAEYFAKQLFCLGKEFYQMEVIKFNKVIQPDDILILSLGWKASAGKLYFTFSSDQGEHSSGRMLYH